MVMRPAMPDDRRRLVELLPWAALSLLVSLVVMTWVGRVAYPYDLEWMEELWTITDNR